jgi:hypothetical protein
VSQWVDVELIYANGERGVAKAAYAGDGWCDVIAPFADANARFWVKSSGETDPPFNPVRLAQPWSEYTASVTPYQTPSQTPGPPASPTNPAAR